MNSLVISICVFKANQHKNYSKKNSKVQQVIRYSTAATVFLLLTLNSSFRIIYFYQIKISVIYKLRLWRRVIVFILFSALVWPLHLARLDRHRLLRPNEPQPRRQLPNIWSLNCFEPQSNLKSLYNLIEVNWLPFYLVEE